MLINNFAKLKRPSRNAIWAALAVIVLIAAYNRIVAPHINCLAAAQRYESVLDNIVNKSHAISTTIDTKRKKLEELRKQFVEVQSVLFSTAKAKEFFSDLQPVSAGLGCAVYSLNLATSESGPKEKQLEGIAGITVHSAMLSVIGSYDNIIRLLEKLQNRTEKVLISKVAMEGLGDDSPQLKCDLTITIYIIQDKEITINE